MRSVGGEPTIPSVRSQDTLNSEDVTSDDATSTGTGRHHAARHQH